MTIPPFKDVVEVLNLVLGFLTGILSVAAYIRISRTNLFRQITIWRLDRRLRKAQRQKDRKTAQEVEFMIQIQKLYCSDAVSQGTAVSQIAEFGDERSLEILAERLGDKPELCTEIKPLIMSAIKKLARATDDRPVRTSHRAGRVRRAIKGTVVASDEK